MRVLFLHTALNGLTAEYKVHVTFAANAKSEAFDPYFIWQSPINLDLIKADRILSYDFGRDMSITPKPRRYQRAGRIIRRIPQSMAFLASRGRKINPDLIYTSQQTFDVFWGGLLSRYLQIPHVMHIHYNVGPWLGKYTLNAIRKSSLLIAVSEYIRQTALLQGADPSAIHTVISPVPIIHSQLTRGRRAIRTEFHLEDDTPLVVAVGRLDPGKGHLALFDAFSELIQQMPNARLLICGSSTSRDNYEDHLRKRVNELQINPYTIFAGQRDDVPSIMRSANVFCLPTELDPCPLVFLEAMAEGIPVVAYYSGGVPEMVLHNQTGLLSYPGDIQALAMNLRKVLSDTTYARRLGEAGKQRVMTEFTPDIVANRWLKVLQGMIEKK